MTSLPLHGSVHNCRLIDSLRVLSVQRGAVDILAGAVDFDEVRIETNRPDGSGEVGLFIAATSAADLARYGDEFASWRAQTRFSTDGGETWEEEE